MIPFKEAFEACEFYKSVRFYAHQEPSVSEAVTRYCIEKRIPWDYSDECVFRYAYDNHEELIREILPRLVRWDKERIEAYKIADKVGRG